ncbi:hypothetical protein [Caballeronia sp. NK8]|uniref:hypothetical protein n=1 Tax=Caballeronia sp. NK8 TaxID=140098 RepID=UPI001BCE7922|nr:hypothetical protein [Caballeronia sp. NK8]
MKDLKTAIDALSALTESKDCNGSRQSEIIDAHEGLKQIADGIEIPDIPRVRRRARKLAAVLLSVAIDRRPPNEAQIAWVTSTEGEFAANYGKWQFAMQPVSSGIGISWRWVARRRERSSEGLR